MRAPYPPSTTPLRLLPLPSSLTAYTLSYTPSHLPPTSTLAILARPSHVLRGSTVRRAALKDTRTLWWTVSMRNAEAQRKVVRSWCNRRMKKAVREALRERGFDGEGRWKGERAKGTEKGSGRKERGLSGTAVFMMREEMVSMKFERVKEVAAVGVEELVKLSCGARNGTKGVFG